MKAYKMKLLFLIIAIIIHCNLYAQTSDSIKSSLAPWFYLDFYYTYDFNKPLSHDRPNFTYSHNRHNEFALNNGIIGLNYNTDNVRSALALHTGTYAQANYTSEPNLLKLIYEAYAGYKIRQNVWVDAGIFTSHIGAESALSIDNLTLSRSIMADNTPYYESGIKLTYTNGTKWLLSGLLLNGWQNIAENNNNKAIGTQVQWKPTNNLLLNSSTYMGKERPTYDTIPSMRYFHNFYSRFNLEKISIIVAFDIGIQQRRIRPGANIWYNPNLVLKLSANDKISISMRIEYYDDKNGVIIKSLTTNGFQTFSPSINFDYKVARSVFWRIEGRSFSSKDRIFNNGSLSTKCNVFLVSSLAIKI